MEDSKEPKDTKTEHNEEDVEKFTFEKNEE